MSHIPTHPEDLSWERRGLDLLLSEFPAAALDYAMRSESWLSVSLHIDQRLRRFAIFRNTGCVYEVAEFGAVADEPLLVPTGSPYTDHTPAT